MPELQDDKQGEQGGLPRKLTWEEMHQAMKRVNVNKKRKEWLRGPIIRKKARVYSKKQLFKKKMKQQEEHPEEVLAKRKFWVIVK